MKGRAREFKVRVRGKKRWTRMIQHPPLHFTADDMGRYAAAAFAEECGLEDKAVVEVQGLGLYDIVVVQEPEYSAHKQKA